MRHSSRRQNLMQSVMAVTKIELTAERGLANNLLVILAILLSVAVLGFSIVRPTQRGKHFMADMQAGSPDWNPGELLGGPWSAFAIGFEPQNFESDHPSLRESFSVPVQRSFVRRRIHGRSIIPE